MSEDEKKEMTDETTQDESAAAAGPDAEPDTPSLTREGESDSTPPAEEAVEEKEPNPEDDLPWKEKRRLVKSREPHKAGPQQTVEERTAARAVERKKKADLRRKQRGVAKAEKTAGTGTPVAEREANAAKVRQGIVVSDKGEKTITVRIDIVRRHPVYEKVMRTSRTLRAHDERNEAGEGDVVRLVETRPLSKTKRWRLVDVLEKAK